MITIVMTASTGRRRGGPSGNALWAAFACTSPNCTRSRSGSPAHHWLPLLDAPPLERQCNLPASTLPLAAALALETGVLLLVLLLWSRRTIFPRLGRHPLLPTFGRDADWRLHGSLLLAAQACGGNRQQLKRRLIVAVQQSNLQGLVQGLHATDPADSTLSLLRHDCERCLICPPHVGHRHTTP